MKTGTQILSLALALAVGLGGVTRAGDDSAADKAVIALPAPEKSGGDLMDALNKRASNRTFADVELSPQELSNLLWATAGVNRVNPANPEDVHFTYPTHSNRQDILLFVVTKSGTFRYLPASHALEPVAEGDHRAKTGLVERMPWVAQAAVNLVFVQDINRWREDRRASAPGFGMMHAGLMMQSSGLYAAAKGWSCVVRAYFEEAVLRELLGLPENQRVLITQTIGPAA